MTNPATESSESLKATRRIRRFGAVVAVLPVILASYAVFKPEQVRRVEGSETGLTYVLTEPRADKDPTIDEDMDELVRETEAMLAGVEQRTGIDVASLPPISIHFVGKGQTVTGDPEQPAPGEADERFNDETDGDRGKSRDTAALTGFSAYKPATRNEFDVAIPARIRSLVLRDVVATGSRDGFSGPDGAKTRSGQPCKAPAIQGKKRCRMHGGTSPGAPRGKRNGNYRHGLYAKEAIAERRLLWELLGETGDTTREVV